MKKIAVLFSVLVFGILTAGSVNAERHGGTFVFCAPYGGDIFSLDMHRTANTQDYIVGLNINRSLYKWDTKQNKPVLDLATSVKTSKDGRVFTYKLRKNVKFHNGRTMTADDIIYSYNRIMNPKIGSAAALYIANIKGATRVQKGKTNAMSGLRKLDHHTLEITLENASDIGYLLYKIETAIVPREEVEARKDAFGTNPVGLGPFKFVKWVRGSEIVLEKFDGYFEPGRPYLDRLIYKIMPEGAARDMAFRAKELDANLVGSAQYTVYKANPVFSNHMIEVAEMYTRLMGFNPNFKPFANKKVRQAINHAINSDIIIKKLLKDKAFKAVSFLPSSSPGFNTDLRPYAYDVNKAKKLMKEAGYENGFKFEVIGTNSGSYGVRIVEAIIPFLKKINIVAKPQQLESGMLYQRLKNSDYQAYIWSLESGPNPVNALARFHSGTLASAGNFILYNNPQFDKLLDLAKDEMDISKRISYLKKADSVFLDDAPIWFFNYNKAVIAHHPWVHGVEAVATEMMYQDFTNLWLDSSSPRAK